MDKHHITPRCLLKHKNRDFVDRPDNIVMLTYEQHVAAHKWLYMLTGDERCEYAYFFMKNGYKKRMNINKPIYKHSPETRKKMKKGISKRKEIMKEKIMKDFGCVNDSDYNALLKLYKLVNKSSILKEEKYSKSRSGKH